MLLPPRATILILVLSTTVWVTDLSICVRHEDEDNHDDDDAVEILSVLSDRLGLKRIATQCPFRSSTEGEKTALPGFRWTPGRHSTE